MKKIINILIGTFMLVSLASCELAGLELQRDATFVPKATDNNVPMTAWEFIQSRPDLEAYLVYDQGGVLQTWSSDGFQVISR